MKYTAVNVNVEDKLGIVIFNDAANPVNTWTDDITEGFVYAIDELKELIVNGEIEGVIIVSGKEGTFHTGANLNKMGKPDTKVDKMKSIEFNHVILNRISALKVPVLAAIDGHCMGGGMELTLACTARMAKDFKTTIIGLPETNVGLFPAGGGTQRLPRLIGYPAIECILNAKTMNAQDAQTAGIVDKVVPANADLMVEAKKFLKGVIDGSIALSRESYDFSDVDSKLEELKKDHLKKTKGRMLPAPKAIFRLMSEGLKSSLVEGLELEKKLFIEVALSPECKGFIHTFFLKGMTDKPQKLMTKGFVPKDIKKAAVMGFGNMGRGIVICILRDTQLPVVVKDTPEALEAGQKFVLKTLTGMYEKKRLKTPPVELMKRIIPITEFGPELADVDIVVEAIFEDIKAKEALFTALCDVIPADSLIASNTSGLSINAMAKLVKNPERFGGLHFFSPVWLMQLVEIVRGEATSQATVDNFLNFAGLIKKRPLVCNDSPGFVVNAVLAPFIRNGLKYIEEGNPVEVVDKAMTDFGLPVGAIKLLDEVGLDVTYHIYKNRNEPQQTLENLFKAGFYGSKKNGKGFFLPDGSVNPEAIALIAKRKTMHREPDEITTDLLKDEVTIAKDLLKRKVVDDPKMIDIGMLYGSGFPSDKGGPLKWSDLSGLSEKLFGEKFYE